MANKEQLKVLKSGCSVWNDWREKAPHIRINLSHAKLAGADLRGYNLFECNLEKADLKGAKLRGACLKDANLNKTDLSGTKLSATDLHGASLFEANLRQTILKGVNFGRTILIHADLSDSDLSGARLIGSQLYGANLERADLSRADLSLANLSQANLRKAFLRKTILTGANLTEALLDDADLSEADLKYTNFSRASLIHTSLMYAYFGGTIFSFLSLKDVRGLSTCRHLGPSSIDQQTAIQSSVLPNIFLRGCGWLDWQIEATKLTHPALSNSQITDITYEIANLLIANPFQFYSGFISYNHEDKVFAKLLHDRLQERGIRCWIDEHQLLPGDDMHDGIDEGIRLWDKVLLCASKASLTSWWVDGEINRAFRKEAQLMKDRGKKTLALIPLNMDGYLFDEDYQSGKKSELNSRVAANFVGWEKDRALFDQELEKVIRALRADAGGREIPPPTKL